MDATSPAFALASTILGGGFVGAVAALYAVRKKAPAERDSIIVSGAETAVLTLQKALQMSQSATNADIVRLEAAVDDRDEHIGRLETELRRKDERIDALERKLDVLQDALNAARLEIVAIRSTPDDAGL